MCGGLAERRVDEGLAANPPTEYSRDNSRRGKAQNQEAKRRAK